MYRNMMLHVLKAYDDFLLIGNRFKGSKYADDANNRLIFLRNSMANHEIYISKYYLREVYLASSERKVYARKIP